MHKTKTIILIRYHVQGTPNHCLALYYGKAELTPKEKPGLTGHRTLPAWIPADDAGMAQCKAHAKELGFTHISVQGDWTGKVKPKGGKL